MQISMVRAQAGLFGYLCSMWTVKDPCRFLTGHLWAWPGVSGLVWIVTDLSGYFTVLYEFSMGSFSFSPFSICKRIKTPNLISSPYLAVMEEAKEGKSSAAFV